jgi:phage shock protein PspC (stress-responsive transcriptional regulator)
MTSTPPEASSGPAPEGPGTGHDAGPRGPYEGGPRATRDEVRDLARIRRSVTDRKVAGVAGGLARHLDIDPVILRVAFVVLAFFGGAGLILYGALWLLLPEEGHESAPLGLDDRSRSIALILVGVVAGLALLGDSAGAFHFPWPLAVLALVVLLFLHRRDRSARPPLPAGPSAPGAPVAGDPPSYATSYPAPGEAPEQATDQATYQGPAQVTGWAPDFTPEGYGATAYQPYEPQQYPPSRGRSPRKRGPILFWFTLALIALAEGVLGIVDLAGADVADPAYPALAVAITGAMLLVGAFFGRAGGLILVGLVSAVALAATTAAGKVETSTVYENPRSAVAVADGYRISAGELIVDLTDVTDLQALDGRTIRVSADVGRVEVIVPEGADVTAFADVHGPGEIKLFGEETDGFDTELTRSHDGGTDVPRITIDADLSVGQIEVHD